MPQARFVYNSNYMKKTLGRSFFNRSTLTVAKDLLGKFIIRKYRGRKIAGIITETEAYIGPHDRASHSFGGKITKRNLAEYMDGGHIYIYLVYGMHWQFNISTRGKGIPECVLIRAAVPVSFKESRKSAIQSSQLYELDKNKGVADGPGKLCRYFKLDKSFYGEDVCASRRIWFEDRGIKIPVKRIKKGPRIGIDYAGEIWAKKPWRFYIT